MQVNAVRLSWICIVQACKFLWQCRRLPLNAPHDTHHAAVLQCRLAACGRGLFVFLRLLLAPTSGAALSPPRMHPLPSPRPWQRNVVGKLRGFRDGAPLPLNIIIQNVGGQMKFKTFCIEEILMQAETSVGGVAMGLVMGCTSMPGSEGICLLA